MAIVKNRLKGDKVKFTEKLIQKILYTKFNNSSYSVIPNISINRWEMDFMRVMKSKLVYEFEIKVSASDLKSDVKKGKYPVYENGYINTFGRKNKVWRPNYMVYVIPKQLLKHTDCLPEWCGIYSLTDEGEKGYSGVYYHKGTWIRMKCVRKPKLIHREKISDDIIEDVFRRIVYRYNNKIF